MSSRGTPVTTAPLTPDALRRLVRARDEERLTWAALALRFGRTERQVRLAYQKAKG